MASNIIIAGHIFPIRLELLINHVIGRAGSFSNYKQQQQRQNLNSKISTNIVDLV
jgi:hypothetical protein